jgi:hypothetical protein
MKPQGYYDCPRIACAARHEVVERPLRLLHDGKKPPRCDRCFGPLRLLRVKRTMPDAVKAALRERRQVTA